jgi:outer membrane protein
MIFAVSGDPMLSQPSRMILRVACTLALIPSLAMAQDAPRPISLDEAVRMAQRNAPASVQALGQVRNSRAATTSALAQFLPRLSVSAGVGRSDGAVFRQGAFDPYTGWNQGRGYSAGILLFDGGQRWFGYRAASTSLEAARENEVAQSFATGLQVKQQYYAALAGQESRAAAERQLEQANQQMLTSTTRVAMGAVAKTDSLRSAIIVSNARIAMLNAQTALDDANVALTRLVGTTFDVTAIASDTGAVPTITQTRDELLAMLVDGPGIRAAEAQLIAAKMTRRSTKTSYLPTITAGYNYGISRASTDFEWGDGPGNTNKSLSFNASFNVFNNWQREQQMVQASVQEDIADAQLRDAKAGSRQNLLQFLGAFRNAEESIKLRSLEVAVAIEDLDAQQQRYAAGAAGIVDLLTAQTTLANARTALINARFTARTAKAQVEGVLGKELR